VAEIAAFDLASAELIEDQVAVHRENQDTE